MTTCPNNDRTSDQAPAEAGDRQTIRLPSQPVRAPAAPTTCQCHRCTPHATHRGGAGDDLDAYIEDLAERAPPLTSEQRDKLALLLNDHRRSRTTGIHAEAA